MINPRLFKCLKRIYNKKSLPDFGAVFKLQHLGLITVEGSSDDVEIKLTDKGYKAIAGELVSPDAPAIKGD